MPTVVPAVPTLSTQGVQMPAIGFGTSSLGDCGEVVATALKLGYRHIGVANFNIALLDEAIRLCPEPLVNLQAEYHPYLDQSKLLEACRRRGLIFTAYCPLGRGRMLRDPVLADIAGKKRRPLAQIA